MPEPHFSGNDVDGAAGVITYTQWLNDGGTLEADLTVTKLGDERFLVVVTDTMVRHAETWMRRNIPDDAHAFVTDVTSAYGQLNVQGPRSRELLQALTTADLSNEAFPFRARGRSTSALRACCAFASPTSASSATSSTCRPSRPLHVYDRFVAAGRAFGLVHAGLKALGSLRMEKGYRDYGHDIDNTDDPLRDRSRLRARPQQARRLHRQGSGGRADGRGARWRAGWSQVLLQDPEPLMFHAEVVRRDGIAVGYVRAASYGHTLGESSPTASFLQTSLKISSMLFDFS